MCARELIKRNIFPQDVESDAGLSETVRRKEADEASPDDQDLRSELHYCCEC